MSDTESLGIEELTDARRAAKTLWETGLLQPHEKTHIWQVIQRIDGLMADAGEHGSGNAGS